jgi:hypothetical protein
LSSEALQRSEMLVALVAPWLKLAGDVGGEASPPTGATGQARVLPARLTIDDVTPLALKESTPS